LCAAAVASKPTYKRHSESGNELRNHTVHYKVPRSRQGGFTWDSDQSSTRTKLLLRGKTMHQRLQTFCPSICNQLSKRTW
jgi:hypothetical protein